MQEMNIGKRKLCIVTETNVAPYYLQELEEHLKPLAAKVCHFIFQAGEKSKNLDTIYGIYEYLIGEHFDRNDILIALGGGVTGDMTGFTAATYLRGISYIQVPTSLLAQVDSSIGGKTGVDFKNYKNMVGAFKQPRLVYINTTTLKTLKEREYLSGMGEVVKHGFIKNRTFLKWLDCHAEEIIDLEDATVAEMIYESCKVKQDVVQRDPLEKGERALLNFGHTLGHAIEKCMNFSLLHGECVALGMNAALYISMQKGNITKEDYEFAVSMIKRFKLECSLSDNLDKKTVIETVRLDKKMDSGNIRFILLESLGNAVIDTGVTAADMEKSLDKIM